EAIAAFGSVVTEVRWPPSDPPEDGTVEISWSLEVYGQPSSCQPAGHAHVLVIEGDSYRNPPLARRGRNGGSRAQRRRQGDHRKRSVWPPPPRDLTVRHHGVRGMRDHAISLAAPSTINEAAP